MRTYRAILFDFDNTLVNYTRAEEEALKATLFDLGILRDEADWPAFHAAYEPVSSRYWRLRDGHSHEELALLTFRETLERFIGRGDAAEELARMYGERFCGICRFEPGAPALLDALAGRYKLGLITNGYAATQRKRLSACGIADRFQTVVISDEVGFRKPDPRIFAIALRALGVRPEEALYVGDSLSDDYAGARNAGVPFCYYNRKRLPLAPDVRQDAVIERLDELLAVIPAG